MSKRALLLLNLGSPRSPTAADTRDYLREFLGDPLVLDMPAPLRWLLLHGVILRRRPAKSAAAYARVWTPQGAPLLATTERLRAALAREFVNEGTPVLAAMRYGVPSAREAAAACAREGVEEVFAMPQYPQFAMSSYGTAERAAREAFRETAPAVRLRFMAPFYDAPGYIAALVESARPWLDRLAAGEFDKLLFSYHGVPLRHIRREIPNYPDCAEARDCCPPDAASRARDYRHQCFATMEGFCALAGIPAERRTISFQSRLGRAAWLRPYTDATLRALPAQGTRRLLVICPAFTADCLETLDEIRNEGRETFLAAGGDFFEQIPCLNDHPAYVRFLADAARRHFETPVA
ncbi:MAG: ferrochelatase [Puniceicoccales bacterium]|jgi:ferrochelatase|nr:ferrochelatase [Puniceicoccales bacterium]